MVCLDFHIKGAARIRAPHFSYLFFLFSSNEKVATSLLLNIFTQQAKTPLNITCQVVQKREITVSNCHTDQQAISSQYYKHHASTQRQAVVAYGCHFTESPFRWSGCRYSPRIASCLRWCHLHLLCFSQGTDVIRQQVTTNSSLTWSLRVYEADWFIALKLPRIDLSDLRYPLGIKLNMRDS